MPTIEKSFEIDFFCDTCGSELHSEFREGNYKTSDRILVEPCETCIAKEESAYNRGYADAERDSAARTDE